MFYISSALLSQTASKRTAWDCLKQLGKRQTDITYQDSTQMKVEAWFVGLWVNIKPYWETGQNIIESVYHQGITTIISWKEVIKRKFFITDNKSDNIAVSRQGERLFQVEGTQQPFYGVIALPTHLTCNCYLFKCLDNRLNRDQEAPQIKAAMQDFELPDGSKPYLRELVNIDSEGECEIEQSCQIQCHHVRAVMKQAFEASTMAEYLLNYQQIQARWREQNQPKREYSADDINGMFPNL